jgi:DNA-directed RNA polymerase sigma subunit (sigma70/sigma32)
MTRPIDRLLASVQPGGAGARVLEAWRLREEGRLTYAQIGQHFGVSRERARQLVAQGQRVSGRLRMAEMAEQLRTGKADG